MKTTNYTIRRAGFEDAEKIFELIKAFPKEVLARPISDIVQNIDRFLVCEDQTGIIGTISWKILPEIGCPKNPSIELKSLAVHVNYQSKGVGSLLIKNAIEHIMLLHPAQFVVLTFTPEVFAKHGFKEVPKETMMHKLYAGCINCTKYDSPFTCPEVAMVLDYKDEER